MLVSNASISQCGLLLYNLRRMCVCVCVCVYVTVACERSACIIAAGESDVCIMLAVEIKVFVWLVRRMGVSAGRATIGTHLPKSASKQPPFQTSAQISL